MQGGTPACAGAAGGAQTDGSVCVCARTHTARANRTQAGSPLELRAEREPPGRSVISTTSHSPHGGSWGRPAPRWVLGQATPRRAASGCRRDPPSQAESCPPSRLVANPRADAAFPHGRRRCVPGLARPLPVGSLSARQAGTWGLGTEAVGTPELKRGEAAGVREHEARGGAGRHAWSSRRLSDSAPPCSLCQPNVSSARGWRRWGRGVQSSWPWALQLSMPSPA